MPEYKYTANQTSQDGSKDQPQPPQPLHLLWLKNLFAHVTKQKFLKKVLHTVLAVWTLRDRLAVGGKVALRKLRPP